MPNVFKKIVLSFLASLVLLFSFAPYFEAVAAPNPPPPTPIPKVTPIAPAEGGWYNQSFDQWYNKVYDENTSPASEIFGERYTAAQVQWVVYSVMAFILNASLGNSSTSQKAVACFLTNSGDVNTCIEALRGLLTTASPQTPVAQSPPKNESLLSLVFADRPFSGISYVKEKVHKFSLVPEAQAQTPGFGFKALEPVQDMWRASRDVSFGLFVLVTIVFAFMIMFRVKISPQVVISVQSAIPKIFIALILTTFSYAIAGFLVDLMYVVIGIFGLILPQFIPSSNMTASQAFGILTGVSTESGTQLGFFGLMGYSVAFITSFMLALVVLLAQYVSGIVLVLATALSGALTGGLMWLLFILILIVIAIICVWNTLKAFWMLLKAFTNILLLTVFAPLQFTLGTLIPGLGFSSWLKSFVANLGTFVGTGVMMFLALIFLNQAWYKTGFDTSGFWLHVVFGPLGPSSNSISPYWPPLLGSSSGDTSIGLLFLGASLVMFTLIPKVADIIQGFMSGKPFAYGSAVGETVAPLSTIGGFVMGGIQKGAQGAIGDAAQRQLGNIVSRFRTGQGKTTTTAGGTGQNPT